MMFATAAAAIMALAVPPTLAQNARYQDHYLVGLLNYPGTPIHDIFKNHTSGTYIESGSDQDWLASTKVSFADVPIVGFSDMEFYYNADGSKVLGEYFVLSDNGYAENLAD